MKTIKPLKLGLLTRCYEHRRRCHLGVAVLAFVPLGREPSLFSEVALWKFVPEELGKDGALDAGIPKAYGEFLVTGRAFAPGAQPVPSCKARIRLGAKEKELEVSGDRLWKGTRATDPVPFTEMPLDWEHAFGGEGHAPNPRGKGFALLKSGEDEVRPLPNVEHPGQRMASPGDQPAPASLGPLDISWPQRASRAGTYDDAWLKEEFPGFARDVDWRIFNLAPQDQHFDAPLRGDEPYLLENLHPRKSRLEGQLPGLAARCFVNRRAGREEVFQEIPTALTTVWFFPHAECAVLVYHGSLEVVEDDASDVLQIVIGAERLGEPKGTAHYRQVLAQRLDKEKGHLFALRDRDLLPDGFDAPDASLEADAALTTSEGLLRRNLRNKAESERQRGRALVASHGLDPDLFGPPPLPPDEVPPGPEQLAEKAEQMKAEAEEQKKTQEERAAQREAFLKGLCAEAGIDLQALRAPPPGGPPKFTAEGQRRNLLGVIEGAKKQGALGVEPLEQMVNDPAVRLQWEQAESQLKALYRKSAHLQGAAPLLPPESAEPARRRVADAAARGESLAGADLTGADLSGLDLHGADLHDAFLESANLNGASLERANLKGAVLAHASLDGAHLSGALLAGANLGRASLRGALADGADFSGAILSHANLSGGCFADAVFTGADCSGAVFSDADFSRVQASRMNFLESDLKGIRAAGASFESCNFLKVDVSGVDFSGASLKESVFLSSTGRSTQFGGADLTSLRLVEACDFQGADFTRARLGQANLRGSALAGARFEGARLDGADLSECDLRGAELQGASAKDTRFVGADLSDGTLAGIDAMGSSLAKANLCGADLRRANLFAADLARVKLDDRTDLAGALTKKTRVFPKRTA